MGQICQTHSDQGKTFQKQKKKKKKTQEGQLAICECLRTNKKIFVRHFRLSRGELGPGGEKTSPSSLSRLPPNQNLKQRRAFFLSKSLSTIARLGTKREKDRFALVTHTTRAPSACASKLLKPTKWLSWCVGDSRHIMVDSSFAVNRRRGFSQLPLQSHSSLGRKLVLR